MGLIKNLMMDTEEIMIKALDNWSVSLISDYLKCFIRSGIEFEFPNNYEVHEVFGDDVDTFCEMFEEFLRVENIEEIAKIWKIEYAGAIELITELICSEEYLEDFFSAYYQRLTEIIKYWSVWGIE